MNIENIPTTDDLRDSRIAMAHWLDRLTDLNVPVPETHQLKLDHSQDGPPEWDSTTATDLVHRLGGEAFIRSDLKSAQMDIEKGSHISNPTTEVIDKTLYELIMQHLMMEVPLGQQLYLREWLDLEWWTANRRTLHPEVRVFIRDGEVTCHHQRTEWDSINAQTDEYKAQAAELIKHHWDSINTYASQIADEFQDDSWFSVDFVIDTEENIYCTDMALDALIQRDGEWHNISHHPDSCPHDLEAMIGAADQ